MEVIIAKSVLVLKKLNKKGFYRMKIKVYDFDYYKSAFMEDRN